MAAMAGLLHQTMTAGRALAGSSANPMAASPEAAGASGSASSAGSSSATISTNDFLTLLVTEMQNQDPTAQTDPNEYINQLVQVNSLEQLISINQNLSTALGSPGTGSTKTQAAAGQATSAQTMASSAALPGAGTVGKAAGLPAAPSPGSSTAAAISQFAQSAGPRRAPGNLSVPGAQAAAHTVAHALDGRSHAAKTSGQPAGVK